MAKKEHKIILGLDARQFQSQMQKVQGSFGKLNKAIKAFGIVSGAIMGARAIHNMEKLGNEVNNVTKAFKGLDQPGLLDDLRASTQGLLSDMELMQSAVRFSNMNLDVKQLGTLMAFAQRRAQETGESVSYLTNSIVDGLGRKSIKILDNLQIDVAKFRDLVEESGDWAASLAQIIEEDLVGGTSLAASEAVRLEAAWKNFTDSGAKNIEGLTSKWTKFWRLVVEGLNSSDDALRRNDEQVKKNAQTWASGELATFMMRIKNFSEQAIALQYELDQAQTTLATRQVQNSKKLKAEQEAYIKLLKEQLAILQRIEAQRKINASERTAAISARGFDGFAMPTEGTGSGIKPTTPPNWATGEGVGLMGTNMWQDSAEQLALLNDEMRASEQIAYSLGDAFSVLGNTVVSQMGDAETASGRFAKSLLSSTISIIAQMIATAIATSIDSGTKTGNSTGALAAISTPAFIALAVGSVTAAAASIPSFAKGGRAPGGMALVGEEGPELVNLPSGSDVMTNRQSMNYLSGGVRSGGVSFGAVRVTGQDINIVSERNNTTLKRTAGGR